MDDLANTNHTKDTETPHPSDNAATEGQINGQFDEVDGGKLHSKIYDEVKTELESAFKNELKQLRDQMNAAFEAQLEAFKVELKSDVHDELGKVGNLIQEKLETKIGEAKTSVKADLTNEVDQVKKSLESKIGAAADAERSRADSAADSHKYIDQGLAKVKDEIRAELKVKADEVESKFFGEIKNKFDVKLTSEKTNIQTELQLKVDEFEKRVFGEIEKKFEAHAGTLQADMKRTISTAKAELKTELQAWHRQVHEDGTDDEAISDKFAEFESRLEKRLLQIEVGFETGFIEAKGKTRDKIYQLEDRMKEHTRGHIVKWFSFTVVVVLSCTVISVINAVWLGGSRRFDSSF